MKDKVFTLQVDKRCQLSNACMVLFSIQRWKRWVAMVQTTLEFYPIKCKYVSGKIFWNVERKVKRIYSKE